MSPRSFFSRYLTILVFAPFLAAQAPVRHPPDYTEGSIVNGASFQLGPLCPNAVVSIFGQYLAPESHSIGAGDVNAGTLPSSMLLAGVKVFVNYIPAPLYFVSPGQINFLLPPETVQGTSVMFVTWQGMSGPLVSFPVAATCPAFFLIGDGFIAATHADGSVIGEPNPARAGEVVVLYLAGLGQTKPKQTGGLLAAQAAESMAKPLLFLTIDGRELPPSQILYAGITPTYAGLYQINLRLPDDVAENPEIRLTLGDDSSPPGVRLRLTPQL